MLLSLYITFGQFERTPKSYRYCMTKLWIICSIIAISHGVSFAEDKELYMGMYSIHTPILDQYNDKPKLRSGESRDKYRVVQNPIIGVKRTKHNGRKYVSSAFFAGVDSNRSNIVGMAASRGLTYLKEKLYVGVVGGVYSGQMNRWDNDNLRPFGVRLGTPNIYVTPILGGEINYKIQIKKGYFMKFNNVISPFVTNHGISIGIEF
jgi:hypothetical protein